MKKIIPFMLFLAGISGFSPILHAAPKKAQKELVKEAPADFSPAEIQKLESLIKLGGPEFAQAFYAVFNYLSQVKTAQECMKLVARFDTFKPSDWKQFKTIFSLLDTETAMSFLLQVMTAEAEDFAGLLKEMPTLVKSLRNAAEMRKTEEQILQEFHAATTPSLIGKLSGVVLGMFQGYINTAQNIRGASEGDTAIAPEPAPMGSGLFGKAAPFVLHAKTVQYTAKKVSEIIRLYFSNNNMSLREREKQEHAADYWMMNVLPIIAETQFNEFGHMWSGDPHKFMHKYEDTIDDLVCDIPLLPDSLKAGVSILASNAAYSLVPAAAYWYNYKEKNYPEYKKQHDERQAKKAAANATANPSSENAQPPQQEDKGPRKPNDHLRDDPHWKRAFYETVFNATQNIALAPLWRSLSDKIGHERMQQLEQYSLGLVSHDLVKFATTSLVNQILIGTHGNEWIKNHIVNLSDADKAYLKLYQGADGKMVHADNIMEYHKFRAARFAIQQISTFGVAQILGHGKDTILNAVNTVGSAIGWGLEQIFPDSWIDSAKSTVQMGKQLSSSLLRMAWRGYMSYKFQQNIRGTRDKKMSDFAKKLPEAFLDKQANTRFAKKITRCALGALYNRFKPTENQDASVSWKPLIGWAALWYLYHSAGKNGDMQAMLQSQLQSLMSDDEESEVVPAE